MTTPTSNPVPSSSVVDLLFNAEKLDEVVNSGALSYLDRFGQSRLTAQGAVDSIKSITSRGAWAASTAYFSKDVVQVSGTWYIAVASHTSSSSFATDAAKWRVYQGVVSGDLAAAGGASLIGTSSGRTVEASLQSFDRHLGNVIDMTAVTDTRGGVLDSTAALQAAIAVALAGPIKRIYAPGGVYRFAAASASIDPGVGDIEFVGDGDLNTIFVFEEGSSTAAAHLRKHLFRNDTATVKGKLEFSHLQIRGTYTAGGFVERGGAALFLNNYAEINVHHCVFYDMSWMMTACEAIGRVRFQDNHCERSPRDMCRFRSSFNVLVTGNDFKNCDDDAVALHQQNVLTGTKIREGIIVANNMLEDVLGAKILGGRMVSVHHNQFRRCKVHAVNIVADVAEGDVTQFGISVKDNEIYDMLSRAPFSAPPVSAIAVYGLGRRASSDSGGIVPGENNPATGQFVQLYPYRNNSYTAAGQSLAPTWFVQVMGNKIARTLPAVAQYSLWGYGQCLTAAGFVNPAVPNASMRPTFGILTEGDMREAQIMHNMIIHTESAIGFNAATSNFGADSLIISRNILSDFLTAGVNFVTPGSVLTVTTAIETNEFDGDPFHTHPNRGANGTWLAIGLPQAIRFESFKGMRIRGNHVRNVCKPLESNWLLNSIVESNVARCDPTATGFSTSNRGIGDIPAGGRRWFHEIVDCNPASVTYGAQLNAVLQETTAQPSSGKYVLGTFVENVNFATAVLGWKRITTGSAHVAGTDWKTVALT